VAASRSRSEPREASAPTVPQLKARPHKRVTYRVAQQQRLRLFQAMIEVVAERGYAGASIRQLCARARVSTRTVYDEFGGKEGYFLATYDEIVNRVSNSVKRAYLSETDWAAQLFAAFDAYAKEVVDQPAAARLALVDALGAGAAALSRMERTSALFEGMIQGSLKVAPDGVALPPLIVKGVVGGMSRVSRQLLLEHREAELPALAHALVRWALVYRLADASHLPTMPEPRPRREPAPPVGSSGSMDPRTYLLRTTARLAAVKTYANLSVDSIVTATRPLGDAFFEFYPFGRANRCERCFLDAYDLLGAEVVAAAAEAAGTGTDWVDSLQLGVKALMQRVGDDPVFARVAFVEVFSVGPAGIEHRSRLMDTFAALLMSRVPSDYRPTELIAEAIVGAVWQVAHHYIGRSATYQLPELTDHATYLTLAPIIGAEAAMERIQDSTSGFS
jgi:AcrR family transcriptional regulator